MIACRSISHFTGGGLLVAVFLLCSCTGVQIPDRQGWLSPPLEYEINQDKIKDVWLDEHGKQYAVIIELLPQFAQEFSTLTAKNIGHELEIIVEEKPLVKVLVKADIQSGIIMIGQDTLASRQEAVELVSRLKRQKLPLKKP